MKLQNLFRPHYKDYVHYTTHTIYMETATWIVVHMMVWPTTNERPTHVLIENERGIYSLLNKLYLFRDS